MVLPNQEILELITLNQIGFVFDQMISGKKTNLLFCTKIKSINFDILCHNEYLLKNDKVKVCQYGPYEKNFYKHLLINGNLLSTSATVISKKFFKKKKSKV